MQDEPTSGLDARAAAIVMRTGVSGSVVPDTAAVLAMLHPQSTACMPCYAR